MSSGLVPITYYTKVPNVGDLANANLVAAITKLQPYQTTNISCPHLLAIGSTLEWATPQSHVWGTGFMHGDKYCAVSRDRVHALRGKLTSLHLAEIGCRVNVPLGDPGFLLPRVLGIVKDETSVTIGIAPHYIDQAAPLFQALRKSDEVLFLDVRSLGVIEFLRAMAGCSVIISSSLHGLVFAEAMGIPNLWVKVSDRVEGKDFKFHDWFSTTQRPQIAPCLPPCNVAPDELARACTLHDTLIDDGELIRAFPDQSVFDCTLETRQDLIAYEQCRSHAIIIFIDLWSVGDVKGAILTIESARRTYGEVTFVLSGQAAKQTALVSSSDDELRYILVAEPITDEFVRKFYDAWAEPQMHIVAEPGFDFDTIDRDTVSVALMDNLGERAVLLCRKGRNLICRPPGRW